MKTRQSYLEQENENPLYETTGGDEALNPIYDRFVCLFITFPALIGISFIAKLTGYPKGKVFNEAKASL